jgi:hypothetical protein
MTLSVRDENLETIRESRSYAEFSQRDNISFAVMIIPNPLKLGRYRRYGDWQRAGLSGPSGLSYLAGVRVIWGGGQIGSWWRCHPSWCSWLWWIGYFACYCAKQNQLPYFKTLEVRDWKINIQIMIAIFLYVLENVRHVYAFITLIYAFMDIHIIILETLLCNYTIQP